MLMQIHKRKRKKVEARKTPELFQVERVDKEFPEDLVLRELLEKKEQKVNLDYLVYQDSKVPVDIPVCQVLKDNVVKLDCLELDL